MTAAAPTLAHPPLPPCRGTPAEVQRRLAEALRRIAAYPDPAVWIHRLPFDLLEPQLNRLQSRITAGEPLPLAGLTFAIKDNIDFAAVPTTAGCPAFAYTPDRTATVVQRLCGAGAILMGKTNLDQFATGLVGARSPFGAPVNPFNPDYIPGGSSSGSAVAVAAGLVDFALGTDTAGSGRVPAAFCNLVGLKPTKGLLSTTGVVPACRSLDCVSIFARTPAEAAAVFAAARGFDDADIYSRSLESLPTQQRIPPEFRFGVPDDAQLEFFGNHDAEWIFRRAIARARRLGGTPVPIDFRPFRDAATLLYGGPWVAERYLACQELFDTNPDALLPITRRIIGGAKHFSAADAFAAEYQLRALRRRADAQWRDMDVLLLPTTGTIYTHVEVAADPIQLNTNLGYYTNFVNLLDLAAVAVPSGFQPNGLPAGVTFIAPAGSDDPLLDLAGRFTAIADEEL